MRHDEYQFHAKLPASAHAVTSSTSLSAESRLHGAAIALRTFWEVLLR